MKLTTPESPIDLLEVLPELADLRATTVRLHPRKGRVPGRHASKMGGTLLWSADEPWPVCDEPWPTSWTSYVEDGIPVPEDDPRAEPFPLVPVLQLRADDFPEMPFLPGADFIQRRRSRPDQPAWEWAEAGSRDGAGCPSRWAWSQRVE